LTTVTTVTTVTGRYRALPIPPYNPPGNTGNAVTVCYTAQQKTQENRRVQSIDNSPRSVTGQPRSARSVTGAELGLTPALGQLRDGRRLLRHRMAVTARNGPESMLPAPIRSVSAASVTVGQPPRER
jgi:hypothetical protein